MTYQVEINGRVRRVDVEREENGFVVAIDGQRHVVDVTSINGALSLIVGPAEAGSHESLDGAADASADVGAGAIADVGAGSSRPGTRKSYEIAIAEDPPASGQLTVHVNGRVVTAAVGTSRESWGQRGHEAGGAGEGPQPVRAPMPGKVIKLLVKSGDQVAARQSVVVVEAMKMENELRSPKAGTVAAINVTEGTLVEAGTVLAVIE